MKQHINRCCLFITILYSLTYSNQTAASSNYLTTVPASPFAAGGTGPYFGAYSPDSKYFATAFFNATAIPSVFSVNSTTGVLTPITQTNPLTAQNSIGTTFSPFIAGAYYFATANLSGTVSVFSMNQTTGLLTEISGSPYTIAGSDNSFFYITYSPNGKWLTVPNISRNSITIFTVNQSNGTLSPSTGTEYTLTGLNYPEAIAYSPDNNYMAIANTASNTITIYSVNQTTGAPNTTPIQTIAAPTSVAFVAYSSDGKWCAAATNRGAPHNLYLYSVNATTGQFTSVSANPYTLPSSASSAGLAFAPLDPSYLAVAAWTTPASVVVYQVSGSGASGILTQVTGSPFSTGGNNAYSVSFSPNNFWFAGINEATSNIAAFKVAYTPPNYPKYSSNNQFTTLLQQKYGPLL